METEYQDLMAAVALRFQKDATGHDLEHLKRVHRLAQHIQSIEGGNRRVIGVAALVHDVHRIIEYETGTFCAPADSIPVVRELIDPIDLTDSEKQHVLHCVAHHEEYGFSEAGRTVQDLETLILQDADNLDAMGAIGIARTFQFAGAYGVPLWMPDLPFDRKYYDESSRDPSVIHHVHSKLLRLRDNMHTPMARAMAEGRHRFMEEFLLRFMAEWRGEA